MVGGGRCPESPPVKLLLPSVAGVSYPTAVSRSEVPQKGISLGWVISRGGLHPVTNPGHLSAAWDNLTESSPWGGLGLYWGQHYSWTSPSPSFLPSNLLFHGSQSQINLFYAELSSESGTPSRQLPLPHNAFLQPLSRSRPQATPLWKFCSTYRPFRLFYINTNHPPYTFNYLIGTQCQKRTVF